MAEPVLKLDKLEALYLVNESVLSVLEVDRLLERVLEITEHTFGFDSCAVLFCDEPTGELYIRAARGYAPEAIKCFRTTVGGAGITGHVAATRQPLFVPDIARDGRYVSGVAGARCEIAIPLVIEDRLLGVLDVESRHEHCFTDRDFEVLAVFASQTALALHNAQVLEAERKRASQLQVFNEIRKRISLSLELDKLLAVVAGSLIEFLHYDQIMVFLAREEGLVLAARAGDGEPAPDEAIVARLAGSVVEAACGQQRTVVVRDVAGSPFPAPVQPGCQAELAVPLLLQRRVVGALYLAGRSHGAFDEQDVHILETICEQLTVILKDASVFSEVRKQGKHLEIVRRISQVAIQSFDLRRFVEEIARLIQEVFGFYSVTVFSYEPLPQQLELLSAAGAPLPGLAVGDKLPASEGIVGQVARTGRHHLCNDVCRQEAYRDVLLHTKSELTLPITHEGRLMGVLNIESPRLNQFDGSDVEIFGRVADQVAYTIANAELFRQKTSAHDLLLELNDLSRRINSSFDVEATLDAVVRELPAVVGCRLCSVFFYREEQRELVLMRHNLPTGLVPEGPISLREPSNVLMAKVIELRQSVHVRDVELELSLPNRPQYQTKSFLNILLRNEDRVLGVLNLTDKVDGGTFSADEFYLVNSFAEHLANAVANAEKYQRILQLSITDGLTGLAVHRHFQNVLTAETTRSDRHGTPLALVMVDVDDFKLCNDTYGHQVGDLVLREIAVVMRGELRAYDLASRYGGEEFGIVLPNTSLRQAQAFAQRLLAAVAGGVSVPSHPRLRVTISEGVAEYQAHTGKDRLIRDADQALLEAKRRGKNRVVAAALPPLP